MARQDMWMYAKGSKDYRRVDISVVASWKRLIERSGDNSESAPAVGLLSRIVSSRFPCVLASEFESRMMLTKVHCFGFLGVFGVLSGIVSFAAYDSLYGYIMKMVRSWKLKDWELAYHTKSSSQSLNISWNLNFRGFGCFRPFVNKFPAAPKSS